MDQYGPFGSTTYTRDASGLPTGQKVTLSPEVQQWLTSQFGISGGLNEAALAQLKNIPTEPFKLSEIPDTSGIAQTMYERKLGLLDPQFKEQENALKVQLANRGIPVGSEVWNNEVNRFQRQRGETLAGAAQEATLASGQEYQRLLSNALLERGRPFEELAAYTGTAPKFQTPSFQQTPWMQIASPDAMGMVQNNYNQAVNQANQKQQSMWSGIGSMAGAAMMFMSDENMKEDRRPADGANILLALRDMPIDDYRYKDEARRMGMPEHRTGPMAQDYAEHFPEGSDGHMIDMADMMGKLLAAVKELDRRTARAA